MNIENLKQAKELIDKQISPKDTETKEFTLLIESSTSLGILIKRLSDPKKAIKLDKLCNGK